MKTKGYLERVNDFIKSRYEINHRFEVKELKDIIQSMGIPKGNFLYTDYAYNRENKGGWRKKSAYPIFEVVNPENKTPTYCVYLGRNYPYTGSIFHYPTNSVIGEWNNGKSHFYAEEYYLEEIKPIERPKKQQVEELEMYSRNVEYLKKALLTANYECEIDSQHTTFIATNNKPYLEGHHLIPMRLQDEFEFSLDCPENIVALCATCHRKIHLGIRSDEISDHLHNMFNKRKPLLDMRGISIDFETLLDIYGFKL